MNVAGTRTRRHTIGLMPTSQTLTCRTVLASAAVSEGGATATEGISRRFIRPDYRLSSRPATGTPGILMLPWNHASLWDRARLSLLWWPIWVQQIEAVQPGTLWQCPWSERPKLLKPF